MSTLWCILGYHRSLFLGYFQQCVSIYTSSVLNLVEPVIATVLGFRR